MFILDNTEDMHSQIMFNDGGEDNTALLESGYVPIEDLNQLNNANNLRGE